MLEIYICIETGAGMSMQYADNENLIR